MKSTRLRALLCLILFSLCSWSASLAETNLIASITQEGEGGARHNLRAYQSGDNLKVTLEVQFFSRGELIKKTSSIFLSMEEWPILRDALIKAIDAPMRNPHRNSYQEWSENLAQINGQDRTKIFSIEARTTPVGNPGNMLLLFGIRELNDNKPVVIVWEAWGNSEYVEFLVRGEALYTQWLNASL